MGVNNVFLNGYIQKKLYIDHPPGVKTFLRSSLKLKKAFYDLKQAPRDWFKNMSNFLL